jgi:hypothetical protein
MGNIIAATQDHKNILNIKQMKLPKYLYTIDKSKNASLIIGTSPPFYIGQIFRFKNEDDFAAFMVNCDKANYIIAPYMIVIVNRGNLERLKPLHIDVNCYRSLKDMADWYLEERIKELPGFYKRYIKIETN